MPDSCDDCGRRFRECGNRRRPPPSDFQCTRLNHNVSGFLCQRCYDKHRVAPTAEAARLVAVEAMANAPLLSVYPVAPTTLSPTPLVLNLPFTSRREVLDALYSIHSPHPGLSFWSLDSAEFPLTAQPAQLRPPYYNEIHLSPAYTYPMPVVPFNLPDTGTGEEEKLPDVYRRTAAEQLNTADVLSHVREGVKRLSKFDTEKVVTTLYQKDNEGFSGWQRETKRKKASPLPSPLSLSLPPSKPNIWSPYNTHLFSSHPYNLCSLMLDWTFAGFSSPSWYSKVDGSFFCMHVEQLFAPFYNICYEGSTTWYVIHREDRAQFDEYIVKRAREWYGVGEDVALTDREREAIKGLLYTKQVVFHPDDVRKAGIRVTQVEQSAGTAVVGDGDLIHFGVVTPSPTPPHSINEAINFLPIQWLSTGLPRLLQWLRWLRDAWIPTQQANALEGEQKQQLREALQHHRTNYLVALHCSPPWCRGFLQRLRNLITVEPRLNL